MAESQKPNVLLIDSHALIHRAYHAFPPTLRTKDGQLVNAAYGYTSILLQLLNNFQPEYLICVFDGKGKTFRHNLFLDYKATRKPTDEDLKTQFPIVHKIVEALNIPMFLREGYEADDILGTLVNSPELKNTNRIIVTGDRDLLQLANEDIQIYLSGGNINKSELLSYEDVKTKLGFAPELLADFKGLRGDSSDNIPGIKGIGEKTASKLIQDFGNLEGIYSSLDKIKGSVLTKLVEGKEIAFLSRKLATIVTDLHFDYNLEQARLVDYNYEQAKQLFQDLQFKSLVSRLPQNQAQIDIQEQFAFEMAEERKVNYTIINDKNCDQLRAKLKGSKNVTVLVDFADSIFTKPKRIGLKVGSELFLIDISEKNQTVEDLLSAISSKKIITHDAKALLHAMSALGQEKVSIVMDTKIAAHLLNAGEGGTDIATLAFNDAGVVIPDNDSTDSFCLQVDVVDTLAGQYLSRLDDHKLAFGAEWSLKQLFEKIELPFVQILVNMEKAGITLDKDTLSGFKKQLEEMIKDLEKQIFEEAGNEFNIASPKQLGEILFEKLGLPGGAKGKSGSYSTNERTLAKLVGSFPIVEKILRHREITKLISTYTDALIQHINPDSGRIHSTFNQTITATGRLSSSNPNLQNIPTSTELGKKIKDAFVAKKGGLLVAFDYSQQELRLLAHLSNESTLKDAFNHGVDIHALTASKIFNIPLEKIDANMRRAGKTINFGIIYGMSSFGLSDRLQIDRQSADTFIKAFFAGYKNVEIYFNELKENAKRNGRVATLFGREKRTDAMNSGNWQVRAALEREVINFPLQGSAADMMKLAMLKSDRIIQEDFSDFAKLILQIHDEIVFEVNTDDKKSKELEKFIEKIYQGMQSVIKLSVPVDVDVEIGPSLGGMEKISGL